MSGKALEVGAPDAAVGSGALAVAATRRGGGRRRILFSTVVVVAFVVVWYVLTAATGIISRGRFPAPADVWQAARQIAVPPGYSGGTLAHHILQSCRLVLMGFVVAASTGVLLGLLMGMSRRAEALINPVFLLLRPIPPLAWIPLGDPVARSRRRRQDLRDLLRRVRAFGDQHLHRRAQHRADLLEAAACSGLGALARGCSRGAGARRRCR